MPEITKSGAKLRLFIVTHKYTDLYFIFSFNNQPQVGKPTWGYDYTTVLRRLPRHIVHHHRIAPTAQYITMRKTAEERFNMLARGWLAYPVTPKQGTGTRTIGMRQRRITPRNPIRTKRQRRAHGASAGTIYMRFGDALLRRPRKRSRLQLTPDRVGGTRTDAYAPRSAAAERSIAKCRKLGRR